MAYQGPDYPSLNVLNHNFATFRRQFPNNAHSSLTMHNIYAFQNECSTSGVSQLLYHHHNHQLKSNLNQYLKESNLKPVTHSNGNFSSACCSLSMNVNVDRQADNSTWSQSSSSSPASRVKHAPRKVKSFRIDEILGLNDASLEEANADVQKRETCGGTSNAIANGLETIRVPQNQEAGPTLNCLEEDEEEDSVNTCCPGNHDSSYFWLQCTRYKPPKLPRFKRKATCPRRKVGRNPRVPFSQRQVSALETKFFATHYLSSADVTELAVLLNLTETRVKIWFQNRRARERRERHLSQSRAEFLSQNAFPETSPAPSWTPVFSDGNGIMMSTMVNPSSFSSANSAFTPVP